MATSTYGTPYVQGSDLVSAYPTVSSSLATRVDEVSYKGNGLNAQTGTTYTLVAGDAGKTITLSNASPVAVTLPQDSTADLPDGAVVTFYNLGAGVVTISQGTGATLQGGAITLAQYAVTSVIKLSANTYGKVDGGGIAGLTPITPTSIANSGGTASLSGSKVTVTGVTSVSLNGVFSATYDNYRLVMTMTGDADRALLMRYRTSGTDNTNSNYAYSRIAGNASTVSGAGAYPNNTAEILQVSNGAPSIVISDIGGPFLTEKTAGISTGTTSTPSAIVAQYEAFVFTATTSFDGFTVFVSAGNITGDIRVYGYSN